MPVSTIHHEIGRLVRHIAVPLVAYAAARGWIAPDGSEQLAEIVELAAVGLTFGAVYLWSKWRERRIEKEAQDDTRNPG